MDAVRSKMNIIELVHDVLVFCVSQPLFRATRNLCFLRFHRRRHPVVLSCCFTWEMVRVGVKIPQDGNRANGYRYVYMVPEHVWRTLCSVCATGARVAQPSLCNS